MRRSNTFPNNTKARSYGGSGRGQDPRPRRLPDQPQPHAPKAFSMPATAGKWRNEHRARALLRRHVRWLAREMVWTITRWAAAPGRHQRREGIRQIAADFGCWTAPGRQFAQPELPDFSLKVGKVEPCLQARGVRRKTAQHLWEAWRPIPHELPQQTKPTSRRLCRPFCVEGRGSRRQDDGDCDWAASMRLRAEGFSFNASIDMSKEEIIIIVHQYRRGGGHGPRLAVPVLHDVEKKNIVELAAEST